MFTIYDEESNRRCRQVRWEWIDGNLGAKTTMKYPKCFPEGGAHVDDVVDRNGWRLGKTKDTGLQNDSQCT